MRLVSHSEGLRERVQVHTEVLQKGELPWRKESLEKQQETT